MLRATWCAAALFTVSAVALGVLPGAAIASDALPLHERIDRLIEAAAVGPLAPPCSDVDFVRRIHLDLTGVIPTAEQARGFLADASSDKRERLVGELLASSAFARHMTLTFEVILLERRRDKSNLGQQWTEYLFRSLADDKPLDQLYRELIVADGADEATRPASRFLVSRQAEPNLVTRDIGRLAFGVDLQCAQCHDHPLIDDYYQEDYYGLFAFVQRTALFTDAKTKLVSLTEKADGEASFKSVFTGDGSDRALPRLPKGAVLFAEPTFAKGDEYLVKPEKNVRGVPKYSRRAQLAEMLAGSRLFRRNVANRIWAMFLGRGIVHPLDFHHADNPPAHPELLSLLADELVAGGFKLRPLVREIVLTRAYQRTCDAPKPEIVNFTDVAARLEKLQRDKEARAAELTLVRASLATAKEAYKAATDANSKIAAEQPKLEKAVSDAKAAVEKTAAERKAAEAALAKATEQAAIVAEAATKSAEAAAKLADDKVLADAAKSIAERSQQLAAAAEVAKKVLAEKSSLHDATAKQLADAEASLAKLLVGRVAPEKLSELQRAQVAASHAVAEGRYSVAAIDQQIATCQALAEYQSLAATDAAKAEAAWLALVDRWTVAGQVAMLKPLTPEQLAASTMQATGTFTAQQASAVAAVEKKPPEPLAKAEGADKPRLQTYFVELRLLDQIDNTFAEFVKHYGGLPGQDFQATVNQALFFGNGSTVEGWLKPSRDNLAAELAKVEDPAQLADEMYLAVFARPASETEKVEVAAYLKQHPDKPAAIGEILWALLSSTEFRFNH